MPLVTFDNLAQFISELRDDPTKIAERTVRWHVQVTPEQQEAITFQVEAWATAIKLGDQIDTLLEFGNVAGSYGEPLEHADSTTPATSTNGSDTEKKWHEHLVEVCDELGLRVRPGKIESL